MTIQKPTTIPLDWAALRSVDLKAGRDIKAPARPFLGVSPVESATELRGVKLEEVIPASARLR